MMLLSQLTFFFRFFSFICPLRRVGIPLSCVCCSLLIQVVLWGGPNHSHYLILFHMRQAMRNENGS